MTPTTMLTTPLPSEGVASRAIADLIGPLPVPPATRIGMIGVGLKMHFVWSEACRLYRQAAAQLQTQFTGQPIELIFPEDPFESPDDVLAAADKLHARGIAGLILFHGSYTAGEIASQLGRWLLDHPMPLLSWAYPEVTGGRLTANSLCCQNFMLNALHRLGVRYQWMFKAPDDPAVAATVDVFARSARARHRLIHGRTLMVGAGRVPGFYDAECDELAVMKRFGVRFDRMDLVQIMTHGRKFKDADLRPIRDAIVTSPRCGLNNVPDAQMFNTVRLALSTLELAAKQNYIGSAIRCWPTLWDEYQCAADGALALINDQGLPAADENDMNGLISMLAMSLLREGRSLPTLMDISRLSESENRLGFWHCGGSATRLLRAGTKFESRKHNIMENADPATAVGMLIESLLATGPATVTRYQSPDSAKALTFEGDLVDSPMAFRGAYVEFVPRDHAAAQVMGTILDLGLDHHWIIGREHFAHELSALNHWLGVEELAVSNRGQGVGQSR
ncbi:MAG: fucose isomerase [Phycisphaeraceae bacterium]|nr:fucose isomerase [Phycisphaeraceae bacterium]